MKKFYHQITRSLSQCSKIATFDEHLKQKSMIINQANQSIKTVLVARAWQVSGYNVFYVTNDDRLAEEIAEDFAILCPENTVFFIPDYETLPYEDRSPHYIIRGQRLKAMIHLLQSEDHDYSSERADAITPKAIYCLSIRNLCRNIINPQYLYQSILWLQRGEEKDPSELMTHLINCGYEHTYQIEKVGQFSHRGGILDIFSPNYALPLRIEFFGDEIVSLRMFSLTTQRSEKKELESFTVVPCREIIINHRLKSSAWGEKVATKGFYEGIEADIPLLYNEKFTLLNFLHPHENLIFFDNFTFDCQKLKQYHTEIHDLYTKTLRQKPLLSVAPPQSFCLTIEEFQESLNKNTHFLNSGSMYIPHFLSSANFSILDFKTEPSPVFNSDLEVLKGHIKRLIADEYKIYIQSENEAQKTHMQKLLGEYALDVNLVVGVLHKGFIFHDAQLAVFTDHEIYKRVKHKKISSAFTQAETLVDYESIKPGDYIVHIDHGIGVYEGIKTLKIGERQIECLSIQYAGADRIYVPTWQLKLVAKYVSEEGSTPLINKIGTKTWDLIKQRTKNSIELVADDIVQLYAERKLRKGIPFKPDTEWQKEMELAFIYEDTPDQARATNEIKMDMENEIPMERLLCGDVGFGKTEVAIRVAFKAIMSGYQVAVIVPTTLLCEQHFQVFRERLAPFPVKIAMLSRFRTNAQIKADLAMIKSGNIDLVIGTHRLLSNDVLFQRIGLLIIDEEHRFGVSHKEKLRKMKASIDTLYMSATPIPRTMNMTLAKLKNISLILTSPAARLPIRTVIVPFDLDVIKNAIQRELDRGGQIYFVHNRVETIHTIHEELAQILPHLRIVIGHGQLPELQLEKVLNDFAEHKFDLLLATTIIESGLDIPNANTIIINRADMFGLAQLYQIRGRVGRSNRRAYAYFVIPNKITDDARKRLDTLTEYESLGAGYQIAMRDLEIRGAGTLLGTKQSGIITAVGFNFYQKLLDQAVKNILEKNPKGIWQEEEDQEELRNIELGTDFYFPQDFIIDEKQKINIYRRMGNFAYPSDFDDLLLELKDRFGTLPEMARNVVIYFKMRLVTKNLGIKSFVITKEKMFLEYPPEVLLPKNILTNLVHFSKAPISFDTTNGLKIVFDLKGYRQEEKINLAMELVDILNPSS